MRPVLSSRPEEQSALGSVSAMLWQGIVGVMWEMTEVSFLAPGGLGSDPETCSQGCIRGALRRSLWPQQQKTGNLGEVSEPSSEAMRKHPSGVLDWEVWGLRFPLSSSLCSLGWLGPHGHSRSRPFGGGSRLQS